MLFDRAIQPQWLALQSFVLVNWSLQEKAGRSPLRGGVRRPFRSVGDRSPTCGTGGLNLMLDVLAQLLEDAFDVIGRAVIGERP